MLHFSIRLQSFTGDRPPRNTFEAFCNKVIWLIDAPVTWFRETIVVPNRPKYNYYHKKYNRVPTIDECDELDVLCMFEADQQYIRDKMVDEEIVGILRRRKIDCIRYEGPDSDERCKEVTKNYDDAALNYFIKYGDLGAYAHARFCLMKQKHRMVHERRKAEGKI